MVRLKTTRIPLQILQSNLGPNNAGLININAEYQAIKSSRKPCPPILAYLGIFPLDLEQLRVLEDDGAVGLLGVGGRRPPERLAVRLGQEVVRLGLRQGAAVLLPAQDHGRHRAVHRAGQQDLRK